MAPLVQTHTNPITFTTGLRKRDFSCTDYDASCGMHRLVITGIIIFVAILIFGIVSLLCVRSQRSKALKLRASRMKSNDAFSTWQPTTNRVRLYEAQMYGSPPPYTPRKPERAARADGDWR
jgi:hypothetical protein